jgi:uncharacterized membrane protein
MRQPAGRMRPPENRGNQGKGVGEASKKCKLNFLHRNRGTASPEVVKPRSNSPSDFMTNTITKSFPAKRNAVLAVAAFMALVGGSRDSLADFKVCNGSDQKVAVAVGYNSKELGWLSEGWWNVERRSCATVVSGTLKNQYYYVYAEGAADGVWSARRTQQGGFFCVRDGKFTLRNSDFQRNNEINCEGNGAKTKQFISVDTKDANEFEYTLKE